MKKKALNLRRRSAKSSIRYRRNQNFRSIFVEIRVCCLVRLKKINNRFLTKMSSLIRLKKKRSTFDENENADSSLNVVVVSIFNRFV